MGRRRAHYRQILALASKKQNDKEPMKSKLHSVCVSDQPHVLNLEHDITMEFMELSGLWEELAIATHCMGKGNSTNTYW